MSAGADVGNWVAAEDEEENSEEEEARMFQAALRGDDAGVEDDEALEADADEEEGGEEEELPDAFEELADLPELLPLGACGDDTLHAPDLGGGQPDVLELQRLLDEERAARRAAEARLEQEQRRHEVAEAAEPAGVKGQCEGTTAGVGPRRRGRGLSGGVRLAPEGATSASQEGCQPRRRAVGPEGGPHRRAVSPEGGPFAPQRGG